MPSVTDEHFPVKNLQNRTREERGPGNGGARSVGAALQRKHHLSGRNRIPNFHFRMREILSEMLVNGEFAEKPQMPLNWHISKH
jgi:hypothetical protein